MIGSAVKVRATWNRGTSLSLDSDFSNPFNAVRVKCSSEDTVGDLKKLIAAQTGTDASKIQLKKWCVTSSLGAYTFIRSSAFAPPGTQFTKIISLLATTRSTME